MRRIKLNTTFDGAQAAFDFKLHKSAELRRSPLKHLKTFLKLNTTFDRRRAELRRSTQVAIEFKLHKTAELRRSHLKYRKNWPVWNTAFDGLRLLMFFLTHPKAVELRRSAQATLNFKTLKAGWAPSKPSQTSENISETKHRLRPAQATWDYLIFFPRPFDKPGKSSNLPWIKALFLSWPQPWICFSIL